MPTNPLDVFAAIPRMASRLPRIATALPKLPPDLSKLPTGSMVQLKDDVTTRIYDTGEEDLPPVVLLHGMAATGMLNWYQTFQRLSGEYRLIAYDQRRHGLGFQSDELKFDNLADDVFRVADHLELEKPILGGYSMGGIVTQIAARRDPKRFAGIVLAATGTGAERNGMERLTMGAFLRSHALPEAIPHDLTSEVDDAYRNVHTWAMRELSSVPMSTYRGVMSEVARHNSTTWLSELDLPAAIVKTLRDIAFPQRNQDEMADLLPHSAVFPIDAGHAVCATHPGQFARRMRTSFSWVLSNSSRPALGSG